MPRRTAAQRKKEKRVVVALAGVVLLAVVTALMLAVPGFEGFIYRITGIYPAAEVPRADSDVPVAVHFIDVGQGDAVLLEAHGEFALIDAGPPDAKDGLLAYLESAGATHLKYIFMTHPHADHIGGMQAVVENCTVDKMILPVFEPEEGKNEKTKIPTTVTFEDLLQAMLDAGVAAETAAEGALYPLGGGQVQVVHTGVEGDDYNLVSLGLVFSAEGLRFLNTGDGEKPNERAMLQGGYPLQADVFMAGHHGSNTSNSEDFIKAVAPRMVVISCGAGNSYGHPHKSALKAFEAVGAQVQRTDKDGHIVVKPDGNGGLVFATSNTAAAA